MSEIQLPLWQPDSEWRPPLLTELPEWRGARRVGLDAETYDPVLKQLGPGPRHGGYVVGYSFALEDGPAHYVPLRHELGDNVSDPQAALRYLQDQLNSAAAGGVEVVGANLSYDMDYLAEAGIDLSAVRRFRDVQIADPLINELHQSYSLDAIAERWELPGKDESLLQEAANAYGHRRGKSKRVTPLDPKADLWRLPARFVGPYAEEDARLPLRILRRQEREIEDQGLWRIYDLESDVLPVLVRMRRRGVRINADRLTQVEAWALEQERTALAQVKDATGYDVGVDNVWKADALAQPLQAIGVELGRTPTGKPQVDRDLLGRVDHPVAAALGRARKVNKLRTTFAASVRAHMTSAGRIHCTFNQLRAQREDDSGTKGAAYGRLSCEHPNLQQQPARDEFAAFWRSIYVPEPGMQWAVCDFAQQEPRMTTHYAELAGCRGAEVAAEKYRNDPSTDNHDMMTEIVYGLRRDDVKEAEFEKLRKQCKAIFLGLCYGMGGTKLAWELGLPTQWVENRRGELIEVPGPEAQEKLDAFDAHAPYVRELARMVKSVAERRGYVVTALGRRCRFPRDEKGRYDWTHKALNRLIQGSSADQTKRAMVAAERAGYYLQLQVHDELDLSVASREEAQGCATLMEQAVPLRVPSKVDVEVGPNWGEVA